MKQWTVTIDGKEYDVDAPDERTAWEWASDFHRTARREEEQRRERLAAASQAEKERTLARLREEEASRPLGDRILTNIGAGMYKGWQGAKQLGGMVGIGPGVSDEEIAEHREMARRAAETVPGGSLLQMAGEVAPTLAVPGGAFARGAGGLVRALGASRAGQAVGRSAIADAALAGGVVGALNPTLENESRALNVGLGAAGGAALPGAVAGFRAARANLTKRGGAAAAPGRVLRELGEADANKAISDIQTYYPKGAEDIPLSTAAITGNPKLAQMERASRATNRPGWTEFDDATADAVWRNVQRATDNAADLGVHSTVRQSNFAARSAKAFEKAKPKIFIKEMNQFSDNIDQALRSPEGQNWMRPFLLNIRRQMDDLGPDFTPQHLAAIRHEIQAAIKGTPSDLLRSAPKSDPKLISLRTEIDDILNHVTGGKWGRAIEGYKLDSKMVTASRAAKAIRETFETPEGVAKTATRGGVPSVTEHRLRRALAQYGETKFGDALPPGNRQRLEATLQALERQGLPHRLAQSGSMGGSNTAGDLFAVQSMAGGTPVIGKILERLRERSNEAMRAEIDRMMRDPELFVTQMRRALLEGKPLSPEQRQILAVLYRAPSAALLGQ